MNHADERVAARLETMRRGLAGAISSDEKLNEELRIDLKAARHHKNPEGVMKRRRSRGFVRFLVAICLGVAGTLAWQAYGETIKQITAQRAPELGWSPEAKQVIASSIEWLGWTKSPSLENTAQAVAPKAPTAPSLDPAQLQQMAQNLAALREMVQQLTANQDQTTREIAKLESVVMLTKLPEPAPQTAAAPARKPAPIAMPSSRVPTAQSSSRPQ